VAQAIESAPGATQDAKSGLTPHPHRTPTILYTTGHVTIISCSHSIATTWSAAEYGPNSWDDNRTSVESSCMVGRAYVFHRHTTTLICCLPWIKNALSGKWMYHSSGRFYTLLCPTHLCTYDFVFVICISVSLYLSFPFCPLLPLSPPLRLTLSLRKGQLRILSTCIFFIK